MLGTLLLRRCLNTQKLLKTAFWGSFKVYLSNFELKEWGGALILTYDPL
jgi:hypothetical protein